MSQSASTAGILETLDAQNVTFQVTGISTVSSDFSSQASPPPSTQLWGGLNSTHGKKSSNKSKALSKDSLCYTVLVSTQLVTHRHCMYTPCCVKLCPHRLQWPVTLNMDICLDARFSFRLPQRARVSGESLPPPSPESEVATVPEWNPRVPPVA